MIIGFSGHRRIPNDNTGYDLNNPCAYYVKNWLIKILQEQAPSKCISGVALGFDQVAAETCIELRIPFVAAVPCDDQDRLWQEEDKRFYKELLKQAAEVVVVSPGLYYPAAMQIRNCWLVNHSDKIVALFDGSRGGTYNCLSYAKICNKEVIRIDPRKYSSNYIKSVSFNLTDPKLRPYMEVEFLDGHHTIHPLSNFPRLNKATVSELNNWKLIGKGYGIHWEEIDEDLSAEGLLIED